MEYPALCLAWISSFCCLVNFANRNTPNNSGAKLLGARQELDDVGQAFLALVKELSASTQH